MKRPRSGWVRAWIGAAAVGASAAGAFAQGPPARVRFDEVRQETVAQMREVTGELRAARRSRVAAEEEGLAVEMGVEVGDAVRAGDVLLRLDDVLMRAEVSRLEAELGSRRALIAVRAAELARAERDALRVGDAMARGGATENEVADARTAVETAEARRAEAEADAAAAGAELLRARERLAKMVVRAPFAGRIVARETEVGQWLSRGDVVAELVELDPIDVWLDVPQRFVGAIFGGVEGGETSADLRPDIRVRVEATGEVIEPARVRTATLIPDADRMARTFPVRVRLANADGGLKPGMSAVALVPTGEPESSMTVHKDAILRTQMGARVFYDSGGTAAVAPVEVVYEVGERVVVRSPMLRPGMRVVIEGNERMYPGQAVVPMDGAPAGGGEH